MSRKKNKYKQPTHIQPALSSNDLSTVDEQIQKLQIVKSMALQNALNSQDVEEIYKAQRYISSIEQKDDSVKPQSLLLDPQSFGANGYKDKEFRLSYEMLRAMANVPVIKAIIETRKEQVCEFMEPQKDKYSKGFIIRPKNAVSTESGLKLTSQQEARIQELTDFMMNCGNVNKFDGDNLNLFTRKVIHDSLSIDQGCIEVLRNRGGEVRGFTAVDGATIRIADHDKKDGNHGYGGQNYSFQKPEQYGYLPYYVQVYQSRIIAEFYPWELCFGIRNPSSNIMSNGYGRSELEDLVQTITSILNADLYNANYFKVGSNPKGILKVSGNVNQGRIQEFKNHFQATMAGVNNSHKLMVIEAEKMDFINTQASNKDMEYGKYQEFLIKLSCAHYKIDPAEIGFPMSGSTDGKAGLGGDNTKDKTEASQDKGLKPLVKAYFNWLNIYILSELDPGYEMVPMGLDSESLQQDLANDVLAVQNWCTVNEIRRKRGLKDLPDGKGDIVLNPIMASMEQTKMQMSNESSDFVGQNDKNDTKKSDDEDKLVTSLLEDVERILTEEYTNN